MKLLVVDDEELNLEILTECLEKEGYDVVTADDGTTAWEILKDNTANFDTIVLDRMMPKMTGMELLAKVKAEPAYKDIPVVMQTAAASPENIKEGVDAGVFYYLVKPFKTEVLVSIVESAVKQKIFFEKIKQEVDKQQNTLALMDNANFKYKTIEEGQNIAYVIAKACPNPDKVILGFSEIFINAVEHGNLGIKFEEKSKLLREGVFSEELKNRLQLPKYKDKVVNVDFIRSKDKIEVIVTDCGNGFDWKDFSELDTRRMNEPNGRGIVMAKSMSFDELNYMGKGNKVSCIIYLSEKATKKPEKKKAAKNKV